jgi:hypothetical protein
MQDFHKLNGVLLAEYLRNPLHPPGDWSEVNDTWLRLSLRTGDAIALAGAAVTLGERFGSITFPCLERDEVNVRSLFACTPTVKVVRLETIDRLFNENGLTTPGVGLAIAVETDLPKNSKVDYYEHIYQTMGVPYEYRWTRNPLKIAAEQVEQVEACCDVYGFVHDDHSRGYAIDPVKVPAEDFRHEFVFPEHQAGRSILAYSRLIKRAKFRHMIDSAFFWMCEHLRVGGTLHRYAKPSRLPVWTNFKTRSPWTIVD